MSPIKPLAHQGTDNIKPGAGVTRAPDTSDFEWESTGDDPQFKWCGGLLMPGWHMLEIAMAHDQPCATVKLFFNTGSGFNETECFCLPLRSSRVNKRLFYVPARVRAFRLDPMETTGRFSITHLRAVWLTPWFAHRRLARRLIQWHPLWRGEDERAIIKHIKQQAPINARCWRAEALEWYAETFAWRPAAGSYLQWLERQPSESPASIERELGGLAHQPLVSIVLPIYNTPLGLLRACIDSVVAQHYANWQLCVVDDASSAEGVRDVLTTYAERDGRIDVVFRADNGHICAAADDALARCRGEFVALLDHDDELAPNALFHVVKAINDCPDVGLLYSDEDKLDAEGIRYDPHFKPDWNPELLLSQNYIGHLCVVRRALAQDVGGFRAGFEGSQDHDLVLRCVARLSSEQIVHVPRILYHWRATEGSTALGSDEKSYTEAAGARAVSDYLAASGSSAGVQRGAVPNTYRVRWPMPSPAPRVSLLIPTRDRVEILQPCVDAILARTDYPDFEVIILDNASECRATLDYMTTVSADPRVRILRWNQPFNYSAINNFGASHATGQLLALVNNDIEPLNAEWLDELVRYAVRPDVGCVGAKLYYSDDTIQHAGVILGLGGVAGHAHRFFPGDAPGYFHRLRIVHNVSAVTAACLVVRKATFDEVGGLDETNLPIAFNDVDFCLKVREAGYWNVFTPYAELYHYESVSRKGDDTSAKQARAQREIRTMRSRWGQTLDNDPTYNPNLTLNHEDFSLR